MKKVLLFSLLIFSISAFSQTTLNGKYACCRNTFVLTVKPNNQYTLVRNSLDVDDSNKGSTLIPSTYKTIQKIYSKKKKKKIWMLMPTTSSLKKSVYLKVENEELFWKQEQDWQKLYKSE